MGIKIFRHTYPEMLNNQCLQLKNIKKCVWIIIQGAPCLYEELYRFGYYLIFFWLSILPFYKSEVRQKSKILTGKEFLNFERKIIQLLNDGVIYKVSNQLIYRRGEHVQLQFRRHFYEGGYT